MAATSLEGRTTCPFLVKLFYRTGAFHRPDEFTSKPLPLFLPVYTFPSCTLNELAHHMAASELAILPSPAIGTRLVFRLVYADTRGAVDTGGGAAASAGPVRYAVKDLGSLVIGPAALGSHENGNAGNASDDDDPGEAEKTLADVRFVVGDYISCAILPPLSDGSVAPASQARSGRGFGIGEGRVMGMAPPNDDRGRRSNFRSAKRGSDSLGSTVPMGEWHRGEEVPDGPSWRGRERGGRTGRW